MQNVSRGGGDVTSLIWWIWCREVRILIQRINNPTGRSRPLQWRRNRWHGCLSALSCEECRLCLLIFVFLPTPFRAQVFVDEIDTPPSFFLNLVEDIKGFFLLATNVEELACNGKAPD